MYDLTEENQLLQMIEHANYDSIIEEEAKPLTAAIICVPMDKHVVHENEDLAHMATGSMEDQAVTFDQAELTIGGQTSPPAVC